MSYDNASPKALKFLVSNGDLLDDTGNVIAHSDSLKDMYDKATPEVKKYLLSDGSVVDEDGNTIIKNDYFKNVYEQAIPKVAKYLHADGTIDENAGGGGGEGTKHLYAWGVVDNQPIITTGFSLSGIKIYFSFNKAPETFDEFKNCYYLGTSEDTFEIIKDKLEKCPLVDLFSDEDFKNYTKISDSSFNFDNDNFLSFVKMDESNDIVIW